MFLDLFPRGWRKQQRDFMSEWTLSHPHISSYGPWKPFHPPGLLWTEPRETPTPPRVYFKFCFVLLSHCRYWDGMPGNRRVNQCYPVNFLGVRSTEVLVVLLTRSSSSEDIIMFSACVTTVFVTELTARVGEE